MRLASVPVAGSRINHSGISSHGSGGFEVFMDSKAATHSSPLIRFLSFLRPHLRLVVGAALMGVGKFTLPLAFPLAFKYIVDVLLMAKPAVGGSDRFIDRACVAIAHFLGIQAAAQDKLAILSAVLLILYCVQAIA